MAARLKLTAKRIPWSLALRAAIFGVAWAWLPLWAFTLLSLYLYLVPLFQPLKLALPFGILLFFAYALDPSAGLAIFLSVGFFLILGIKDLILIDRRSAQEMLVLLLLFLIFFYFFSGPHGGRTPEVAWSVALGVLFFLLVRGFLYYPQSSPGIVAELRENSRRFLVASTGALLVWQFSLVLLFLPISALHQAALLFIFGVVFLELFSYHIEEALTRERMLVHFSIFFILTVALLASIEWSI